MPRLNNGQEVFKYLNTVSVFRIPTGTIGDTLTTAPIVRGDDEAAVTAITNFSAADWAFIIGSGGTDLVQIGTPNVAMPLALKALFAQNAAARFVEAVETNLGHISEQGVTVGGSLTLNAVRAATSRTPIAYVSEPGEMTLGFSLLGHNNLNLAMAFGATEDELGTGTAEDPYAIGIGSESMGSQGLQAIRLQGVRHDGMIVDMFSIDAQVEVNVNMTLGSGQQSGTPVSMKFTNLIQRIYA